MAFLSRSELEKIGFKSVGRNVQISSLASIHNPGGISIGDNSRVDDFCVLSAGAGGLDVGRHVHVACFVSIIGRGMITLEDFCGVSSRSAIYSSNDDYSGLALTGPTIPEQFTNVKHAPVRVGRHVVVGAGSVVLPGVTLHEGCAVGALSLVTQDCEPFSIYRGVPAQKIGRRSNHLLKREQALLEYERSGK